MDVNVNVYGATATAQRDRALALSRKFALFHAARMGGAVTNIDAAEPHPLWQSRAPTAQRRTHDKYRREKVRPKAALAS